MQIGRTKALEEAVKQNKNWNISFQQSGDFTEAIINSRTY